MAGKGNPRRYAQAVFELARENNDFDTWQANLQKMTVAVRTESFLDLLENPGVSPENKTRFLKETLRSVSRQAMNLAMLLVSKSMLRIIPEVSADYITMLDAYLGIDTAAVTTAVPLDENDKEKIKAGLSAITGKKIEMTTEVNSSILGGVIARVGGKLLDGSTRSKLAALKKQLEAGDVKKG